MLVKIIGMLYKIPLGNILGAGGMSYFMSAYSIFNPILSLSVAGFPVAVSKLVSEAMAKGRYRDVRRIYKVSAMLFLVTGLLGTAIMLAGSGLFANAIDNPAAKLAVFAMAPAVLFCCVMSVYRGYYQGLRNMNPTAVSQVLESLVKLICGMVLANWVMNRGLAEYQAAGTVFGQAAESLGKAKLAVLPYAAAGAVLGVTLSTVVGALFLMGRHFFFGDGIGKQQVQAAPAPHRRRSVVRQIVSIALPVCLASAVAHITTVVDVATIMNRVAIAIERDAHMVLGMYQNLLPTDLTLDALPSYLYGAFTYTSSLFNLVPALTVALGISALPVITSYWAVHQREQAARSIASVIKLSTLLSIPAGLGLSALAQPILELLYPARLQEMAIAAPMLRLMGIAAVFVGITTPLMSIFQAVGRVDLPVKLMLCGGIVKVAANYILLAIPALNIGAAPIGTILCYFVILSGGVLALREKAGVVLPIGKTFLKPLLCGIICALAAHTSYALLARVSS